MVVIAMFNSSHCHENEVVEKIAQSLKYEIIENRLLDEASQHYHIAKERLIRAMQGPGFIFNKFTHAKEKYVAYIKASMARLMQKDNLVYFGYATHLIPRKLSHVLRVALVATREYRISQAMEKEKVTEKEAQRLVQKDDEEKSQWVQYVLKCTPWDKKLYDIMIPMHTTSIGEAVQIIYENAHKPPLATTENVQKMVQDFLLAANVNVLLAEKGHDVECDCEDGKIILTLHKYVMRLESYENELKKIAAIEGVKEVEVRIGPDFQPPTLHPLLDIELELPSKVLLVDDEKEFVHTLSERLQTRKMEAEVVYNGEEALNAMAEEEPEVMILDLKMPGIDGIEVLRRVRKEHPNVQVIILTGHGSEKERKLAEELGAYAYLQKPVDINVLTQTMKSAYKKIREMKQQPKE